jgi:hypothetical protein
VDRKHDTPQQRTPKKLSVSGISGGTSAWPRVMPNWGELKASMIFECAPCQETDSGMVTRRVTFLEEPKAMPCGTFVRLRDPELAILIFAACSTP